MVQEDGGLVAELQTELAAGEDGSHFFKQAMS